jgi:hypothetical protein
MRLVPRTEEELLNLLPDGEYDFFIKQAEDTLSKQKYDSQGQPLPRNEMIKLTLGILDAQNKEHILFDYLLEAMAFKVKHFAEAVGLEDKYNAGCYMADDCWNKSGRCYVTRQEAKDGFQAKNNVSDYIRASDVKPKDASPKADSFSDEIPF